MSKKSKKNTVNTVMNKEENVMSKKNVAAVSVSKGEVHKLSVCVDDVVVMTNVVSVPTDSALKKVKMCIEFDLADIVNSDTVTAEPVEAVNNVVAVAEQTEQVVVDEPEVVVPQAITALAVVPNTESEKNNVVTIKAADMLNSDEKTYFVKSLNNIIKALVAAGCENDEVPFDTTNEEIEATETPVAEVTKTKMVTEEQEHGLRFLEKTANQYCVGLTEVIKNKLAGKNDGLLGQIETFVFNLTYKKFGSLFSKYVDKQYAGLFCNLTDDDAYNDVFNAFEQLGVNFFEDGVRVEHCGVSSDVAVNTVDVFLNNSKDGILNDESFNNQLKAASSFGDYRQYIADITKKFIKLIADMFSYDDEDGEEEDVIPTAPVDPVIEKAEEVAPQAPATTEESSTLVVSADGSNQFMFHGFMVEGGYEEEEGVIPVNPASSPEAPIHKDAPPVTPATEESVVPTVKKAESEMDMSKFAIPLNDAAKNASKKTVKKETKNGEANQTKETTTSTPKSAKTVSGGNTANDAEVDTSVIHITPLASDREILVRYKDRNNMPFNKVNLEVSDYEDGKKYRNYNLSHAIVDTLQSIINNSKLNKNCKVVVIHTGAFYVDKAFHDPSIVWDTLLGKREPKSDVARKYRKDFIDFTKKLSDMGITVLCNVPSNIDA